MELSKGDRVRYLNSKGGGEVVGFTRDGKVMVLDDAIEMEIPMPMAECVLVSGTPGMSNDMKVHYTGGVGVKVSIDAQKEKKPKVEVEKRSTAKNTVEVDLHIDSKVKGNALTIQMDRCRRALNQYKNNKGTKIVFIHGKGDGTLRLQIMKIVMNEFPSCSVSDASFAKYGMYGATEVTI